MRLYKNDGVTSQYLCFFFGECTEVVYITYTMATRNSPDIYIRALGHGITITYYEIVYVQHSNNGTYLNATYKFIT